MELIEGEIKDISPHGVITITAQYNNLDLILKRQYKTVEIGLNDGRTISDKQRKTIHSLIGSIADYSGDMPEGMKYHMKMKFLVEQYKGLAKKMFSLSDCDMTLAHDFTKYLIEFILNFAIPLNFDIYEFIGDDSDLIKHFVWSCLKHKKCCLCGKKTELHHVDQVGMGNNRDEIIHEGMQVLPLCTEQHIEAHRIGKVEILKRYHLQPIVLDKELCKVYKLKARERNG